MGQFLGQGHALCCLKQHQEKITPVFILAHGAVASGMLYLGGRFLFRKFHAPSVARTPFQENLKAVETEGNTIRWAFFYDLLVKGILLGKEEKLRNRLLVVSPFSLFLL